VASHMKTVASAKEVSLGNGTAGVLLTFTDGDFTWCVIDDANEFKDVKSLTGETLIIEDADADATPAPYGVSMH
jgi:hypothetical protein